MTSNKQKATIFAIMTAAVACGIFFTRTTPTPMTAPAVGLNAHLPSVAISSAPTVQNVTETLKQEAHTPTPNNITEPRLGSAAKPSEPTATELGKPSTLPNGQTNYVYKALLTPNDPLYSQQWYLPRIDAPTAWNTTTGSATAVIAIIDTGVLSTQQDLSAKIWSNPNPCVSSCSTPGDSHGWDFVDNDSNPSPYDGSTENDPNAFYVGHGTMVASVAAASSNNLVGMAGVDWNARIMPLRALNGYGFGTTSSISAAIRYAADHGANVINMSFGDSAVDPTLQSAVQYAYSKGAVLVAAAGNSGTEGVSYPASDPDVIAVSATDQNNHLASFSSYGPEIDISAPGVGILAANAPSTSLSSNYYLADGTSFAAPQVSGSVSLLFARYPGITPAQAKTQLEELASPVPDMQTNYDEAFGYGLLYLNSLVAGNNLVLPVKTVSGATPVYRFYSAVYQNDHFFTTSLGERNNVIATWPTIWKYEGIAFEAYPLSSTGQCPVGKTPIYRFYAPAFGNTHFFTSNQSERDTLINNSSLNLYWKYEGTAFCGDNSLIAGDFSVYRFYAPGFENTHFYTDNASESQTLQSSPLFNPYWHFEGVAWYAPSS